MPSMESPQGKCNQYSGSLRRSRAARRELALGWGAARHCPPKTRDRCDEPEGLLQGQGPGPPRGRQAWPRSVRAGGQQGHQTREVLRAALRSPCQRSLPLALCKESPCPAAAAPLSVPDSERPSHAQSRSLRQTGRRLQERPFRPLCHVRCSGDH